MLNNGSRLPAISKPGEMLKCKPKWRLLIFKFQTKRMSYLTLFLLIGIPIPLLKVVIWALLPVLLLLPTLECILALFPFPEVQHSSSQDGIKAVNQSEFWEGDGEGRNSLLRMNEYIFLSAIRRNPPIND